ncbi:MAG TPA: D-alanyl-D-alanine carboxypeptidase/D-alanyl-D-alanine-endopeptidase [Tepidisphaeraceae bacterium]|nr:D-alanyl-D-alanine carboxypeptidase/D-alanyl-D-alanine-endopeptidase [Tepidisphaeraceae bacterium]
MTKRVIAWVMVVGMVCLGSGRAWGDLESSIRKVLADRLLAKGAVGVQVVALGDEAGQDRVLFEHNGTMPLIPASNMKVVTTSAAMELLGADFRFRTLLVKRGEDLILVGDGDPSFGDAELLKKVNWETTTVFKNWAQELKKAGFTKFARVLVDDSVFDEVFLHPHWPADQQQTHYMAQVCGMTMNANCLDFYVRSNGAGKVVSYRTDPATHYAAVSNSCTGGGQNAVWLSRQPGGNQITLRGSYGGRGEAPVRVTIHDSALYAATVLSETLTAAGITVQGKVARDRTVRAGVARDQAGTTYTLLAVHETPLAPVLARANKDSMNLYAESLCKRLGYAATGQSGSWENGTAAVGGFLKKIGVDEKEFRLDDGCGLSRQNGVSVRAMGRVLAYNFHSSHRAEFMESLAVGGEDGTLDNRFKQDLRGRVMAKTGYIAGVSALSGYVKGRDDHWYAFSILMNGLPGGTNYKAKSLQESIVKAIDVESKPGK